MKRRNLLLGAAAVTAGALLLRPRADAAPHDAYFGALNALLRREGQGRPVLVVDLDRVERNCQRLKAGIAPGKHYRVVAKSLPAPGLLRHVMQHTGTSRLMSFHQPFLNALAADLPQSDLLLGKPMPVQAAATFYRQLGSGAAFAPERQLQWLIDTPERLAQYAQLARTLGTRLNVNVEIDVGLHRGGLHDPAQLDAMLDMINAAPAELAFSGFMGYDAHVGKVPSIMESRDTSLAKSLAVYRAFIDRAWAHTPALRQQALTFNGAGSPTFRLHDAQSPVTEVAAGSCLVKPTDFDLALLDAFEPAAFIATPVLKASDGLQLPGSDSIGRLWSLWDANRRRTYFIYGGKWMAKFVSPAGLRHNDLYGSSTNQAIVNSAPGAQLAVDDHLFLRPTQSEAVLLQFGDIMAVRNTPAGPRIEAYWPVLAGAHDTPPVPAATSA